MNKSLDYIFAIECLKVSLRLGLVLFLPSRYFEDELNRDRILDYVLNGKVK